jgi:hypothetical protein
MKLAILTSLLAATLSATLAADFSRATPFNSVQDFVAAAKQFQPGTSQSDLSALFVVPELGQPEDPKTGTPVFAKSIESCETLWANDSQALVFAKALPPTEATNTVVAVLFLIKRTGDSWRITDTRRFTGTGGDSGITAKLTAETGGGPDRLGTEGFPPVITVTEAQGGRGYSYTLSASYRVQASKLERLDLE